MIWWFVLLLFALSGSDAHKYLVYNPRFGHSQVIFMGRIADILSSAGHDVVNYLPQITDGLHANGSKLARNWIREKSHKSHFDANKMKDGAFDVPDDGLYAAIQMYSLLGGEFKVSCDAQLSDNETIEALRRENFDLGFSEMFDICGFFLFERIGIKKTILVYSHPIPPADEELFGVPSVPSFVPAVVPGGVTEKQSFADRLSNLLDHWSWKYFLFDSMVGPIVRSFPNSALVRNGQIFFNASYYFVNSDEFVDFPRPISHKLVNIGGLGMTKGTEPLEKDLEKLLSTASDGVVFISMGSVASSSGLPLHVKEMFISVFQRFPTIRFLWKYENTSESIGSGLSNVFKRKWFPQREILTHPNLRVFITHSGMNSVAEATAAGVPMLCIPLFHDQQNNAAMVESRGIGIRIDKRQLNAKILGDSLERLLSDNQFQQKSRQLAKMIAAKPMSADERIIRYSEFAVDFDVNSQLDMRGRHLSAIEFHNLDIYFCIYVLFSLIIVIFVSFIRFILLQFCCGKKLKEE